MHMMKPSALRQNCCVPLGRFFSERATCANVCFGRKRSWALFYARLVQRLAIVIDKTAVISDELNHNCINVRALRYGLGGNCGSDRVEHRYAPAALRQRASTFWSRGASEMLALTHITRRLSPVGVGRRFHRSAAATGVAAIEAFHEHGIFRGTTTRHGYGSQGDNRPHCPSWQDRAGRASPQGNG